MSPSRQLPPSGVYGISAVLSCRIFCLLLLFPLTVSENTEAGVCLLYVSLWWFLKDLSLNSLKLRAVCTLLNLSKESCC